MRITPITLSIAAIKTHHLNYLLGMVGLRHFRPLMTKDIIMCRHFPPPSVDAGRLLLSTLAKPVAGPQATDLAFFPKRNARSFHSHTIPLFFCSRRILKYCTVSSNDDHCHRFRTQLLCLVLASAFSVTGARKCRRTKKRKC